MFLNDINPLVKDSEIIVKIDQSFAIEVMHYCEFRSSKDFDCVAFVVYDQQGTRMMVKLVSDESTGKFLGMLYNEAVYEMTCAVVGVGGEGVHEDYHLILNERSELSSVWAPFPSLPLRLKRLSEVPISCKADAGFFDVAGFVQYCGIVHWTTTSGYLEKEFVIILQSFNSHLRRLFERFGGYAVVEVGFTSVSNRNPSKVAFCPKEVKSILEFEVLLQKYVHSHTIRKIIVFASLNITHGSEDKNELFLNHLGILKKGEPCASSKNAGT